jgi:Tfp pilus assembly protein PilF
MGMAYARKGEDAKARRFLSEGLKIDSHSTDAQQARKVLATLVY